MDQNLDKDTNAQNPPNEFEGESPEAAEPEAPKAPDEPKSSSKSSSEEGVVSNLGEKSKEFASDVKESTTGMLNKLNNFRESSSGKIIVMTIVGILIVGIIAFLLYYIIKKTVVDQSSYIVAETTTPLLGTQITNCNGSPIPNPSSGVRSGMTFWIYIYDISKYQGSVRHVFHRGLKTDGFASVGENGNTLPNGPYVALDSTTSSLYVVFAPNSVPKQYFSYSVQGSTTKTSDAGLTGTGTDKIDTLKPTPEQMIKVAAQSTGIVFPYIPLQRWVHVGVVVNENVNGGTITGYIDGELVLSVNQSTKTTPVEVTSITANTTKTVTPIMNLSNMNISNTGDIYVGGSPSDPIGPGFSGLVSKIQFANYDMSAQDVYANYQSGPINNALAALGLPAYGLQSPIYKIA